MLRDESSGKPKTDCSVIQIKEFTRLSSCIDVQRHSTSDDPETGIINLERESGSGCPNRICRRRIDQLRKVDREDSLSDGYRDAIKSKCVPCGQGQAADGDRREGVCFDVREQEV